MNLWDEPAIGGRNGAEENVSAATEVAAPVAGRILLVEDDVAFGSAAARFLRHGGYAVEHRVSAAAGRSWIAEHGCDLVITDILMPDSDGLELIRWLRREHPLVKIVAISGSDMWGKSHLRVAQLMGASRVLSKPFELAALAKSVEQVLKAAK